MTKRETNQPDEITLKILAQRWAEKAPLRMRHELASGECKGKKFSVSLCVSGSSLYFMSGDKQIAMPLRKFVEACLEIEL